MKNENLSLRFLAEDCVRAAMGRNGRVRRVANHRVWLDGQEMERLPILPPEFVAAGEKLTMPLSTRFLYGGITEELLVRWGLMTLIVWLPYRFLRKGHGDVPVRYYWTAIVISAVKFGLGHLPIASLLSPTVTTALVVYVVIANALFGLIAGYLYWKRGLESAILAHMLAHVVMVTAELIS